MTSSLTFPPKIQLGRLGTPLQPLERLSARLGTRLLCKRDDLTGAVLSGNKVRKLEHLLWEAKAKGAASVITCGGEQSNHARATAVAAAQLRLRSHLLLRTADPGQPPALEGNVLLDRLVGATIRWISPSEYADRDALMQEEAKRMAHADGSPAYVIPEGGSNALGAWGYVRCAQELREQLGAVAATVVYAVGSGGTAAGLHAGCRLLGLPYRLVGVCVCDNRAAFQRRIASILAEMADAYRVEVQLDPTEIELWEDYVGLGYAISREEELLWLRDVARLEGVILDPVYSGKAFYALRCELERGTRLPEPIVFLHTGGIYGLFPKASQLAPLL